MKVLHYVDVCDHVDVDGDVVHYIRLSSFLMTPMSGLLMLRMVLLRMPTLCTAAMTWHVWFHLVGYGILAFMLLVVDAMCDVGGVVKFG